MSWIVRKQARDGSDEVGRVVGERFDHREDAAYLAALLEEHSSTHRFWADEEIDYEYMVLKVYALGTQNKGLWTTKEKAETVFKSLCVEGHDPVWGPWTAKLVRRRKAGPIEDVA